MKIVVDTNIVFSALPNSSGNIGKVLVQYGRFFEFYSCDFLREELIVHQKKLHKLTKLSSEELNELLLLTTKHITFINEQIISSKSWEYAIKTLSDVDKKDTPFVALAHSLKAYLWTGDKQLIKGLRKNGFVKFVNAQILLKSKNEFSYRLSCHY